MQVLRELEQYIDQALGASASVDSWGEEAKFPFFLREAYDFFLLQLMGREYLLLLDAQTGEISPSTIRKHVEQLQKVWSGEMIYVRDQVTAYNRKRLITNKIPFVVPGNQMYLPMLAIDLREHFVTKRTEIKKLSPAAQVLVLYSIYKRRALFDDAVTMTEWAEKLGYTKMTMTRAFRELRSILGDDDFLEEIRGRKLWDCLRSYLRSPVRHRKYYNMDVEEIEGVYRAGDSALSELTLLSEGNHRVVCTDSEMGKKLRQTFAPFEVDQREPGCVEFQVWKYDPGRLASNAVADPLSVYLSYDENADERVEMALEDVLEGVQW